MRISTDNADHYFWGEGCDGWHLVKTPQLSVIQERMPPRSSEVRHYHQQAEQFFYILSGVATMEMNGSLHILKQHEGIHVPAGTPHQLSNQYPRELVFTVTSTPPSHGDRIICDS